MWASEGYRRCVFPFSVIVIAAVLTGCPFFRNDRVTVPDVVELSQSDAEGNLALAGLTVGTVTYQNSATVPMGDVISQSRRRERWWTRKVR
jgi:beta-lactam-binding protein with PASTA domain